MAGLRSALGGVLIAVVCGESGTAVLAAADQPIFGPPIANVCVFGRSEALDKSQAGLSANQQMLQFTQGVQAELTAERTAIVNDDRALAKLKASMSAAAYQQRVDQLKQRYDALDRTSRARNTQLAKTRNTALDQIGTALNPSLAETITSRHCSVVLEKAQIYGANAAMDITPQVIQLMNTHLPIITLRLAPPETADAEK
jgi:Skp family chaperone for outer membrane proteins